MNNKILVSVIIPTYNQADFLHEAIQSVIDQTFTQWEMIVVNNFSEDHTEETVTRFADSRIRLINFKNHGVIAASRNEGIRLANGEIIAFLDSDDKWYPEKLSICMEQMKEDVDLVCHGLRYTKNGQFWRDVKLGPVEATKYLNLLYKGNCLTPSAVIVRKSILLKVDGFSEDCEVITAEDYDLWLKLAREKIIFKCINDMLGEYRLHANNASKSAIKHCDATRTVVTTHFIDRGGVGLLECVAMKRRTAYILYGAGRSLQQAGCTTEALRYFSESIKTFPLLLRAYIAIVLLLFKIIK